MSEAATPSPLGSYSYNVWVAGYETKAQGALSLFVSFEAAKLQPIMTNSLAATVVESSNWALELNVQLCDARIGLNKFLVS